MMSVLYSTAIKSESLEDGAGFHIFSGFQGDSNMCVENHTLPDTSHGSSLIKIHLASSFQARPESKADHEDSPQEQKLYLQNEAARNTEQREINLVKT